MHKFKSKNIRYGGYASLVSLIVIIIALVVNILVSDLDIKVDLTSNSLYSLSESTQTLVKDLDAPITIYVLAETGNENPTFKEILTKYSHLNSKLSIVYKDPVLYPQFTKQYLEGSTTDTISTGSLIVENTTTGKYKVIPYSSLYNFNYSNSGGVYVDSLAIENEVTSAISYVARDIDGIVYVTSGHGELDLPTGLNNAIESNNLTTENITLLTDELVAEEGKILVICSPHSDFADVEVDKVINFLDAGGSALILTDYDRTELPNFERLLAYYGITHKTGIVVEGDSKHMLTAYPTYVLPDAVSHDLTSNLNTALLFPLTSALEASDSIRNTLTLTPILTTSSKAYLKTNLESSTLEKADEDIEGPLTLAYAIEENNTINSDSPIETRLFVAANTLFLDDAALSLGAAGNQTLISNTLAWLSSIDTSFAIASKSFENYTLSTVTSSTLVYFGLLTIIIIPLLVIVCGIIVWVKRRHL